MCTRSICFYPEELVANEVSQIQRRWVANTCTWTLSLLKAPLCQTIGGKKVNVADLGVDSLLAAHISLVSSSLCRAIEWFGSEGMKLVPTYPTRRDHVQQPSF